LAAAALAVLATPVRGQSLQLTGYAGVLGEWELSATIAGTASDRTRQYTGALKMKHVGVCTQDGPEEKTGEIRIQLSGSTSRMKATLLVDGVQCAYHGRRAESYTGLMNCPDRRAVPLVIWLK
jgi:hypothetical protein